MSIANPFEAFLVLIGLAFCIGVCGAALTFGICLVCRWMEWSPVNVTVEITTNVKDREVVR